VLLDGNVRKKREMPLNIPLLLESPNALLEWIVILTAQLIPEKKD
jgi:hypothetical protein